MNKFTHEHRLNEYLITLKAFIMYKYSQENQMYAQIHEYRLNERLYSNVHVHWNRLNADSDCVYTTKKKMLFVIGIHVPNMEI